jgi:hypothetical protein
MIGDHHGRTAGSATLLVRAMDGILGTHSPAHAERSTALCVAFAQVAQVFGTLS